MCGGVHVKTANRRRTYIVAEPEYREFRMAKPVKPSDVSQIVDELFGRSDRALWEADMIDRFGPGHIVSTLEEILSPERKGRIENVLSSRSETVATVVEGVLNTGNVSAVMRTAEALGFHLFHVITNSQPFKQSTRTTQGAHKWLDIREWDSAVACAMYLKDRGYRIVVMHLDEAAEPIESVDFREKTVLIFGNELSGVTEKMRELADSTCVLPVTGFVQSFNISVAAAIALQTAFRMRVDALGQNGDLTQDQLQRLRAIYFLRATDLATERAEDILERTKTPDRDHS